MLEGCRISRAFQRIVEAAGHLRRTSCEVFPTIKAKQCSSYLVTLYMLVLLLSRSPNRITNYILWKDDKLPSKPMQSTGDSLLCLCINPRTSITLKGANFFNWSNDGTCVPLKKPSCFASNRWDKARLSLVAFSFIRLETNRIYFTYLTSRWLYHFDWRRRPYIAL